MAMRAGRALRDKWTDEARYAADPGYHARHWRAGEMKSEIVRRYTRALLASGMAPEDAMPLLIDATDRVRVVEHARTFRVTARRA